MKIALICLVSWMTSKARIDSWHEIESCHGCLKQNWRVCVLADGLSITFCSMFPDGLMRSVPFTHAGLVLLYLRWITVHKVATCRACVCLQTPGNAFQLIGGGRFIPGHPSLPSDMNSLITFSYQSGTSTHCKALPGSHEGKSLATGHGGTIKVRHRVGKSTLSLV